MTWVSPDMSFEATVEWLGGHGARAIPIEKHVAWARSAAKGGVGLVRQPTVELSLDDTSRRSCRLDSPSQRRGLPHILQEHGVRVRASQPRRRGWPRWTPP